MLVVVDLRRKRRLGMHASSQKPIWLKTRYGDIEDNAGIIHKSLQGKGEAFIRHNLIVGDQTKRTHECSKTPVEADQGPEPKETTMLRARKTTPGIGKTDSPKPRQSGRQSNT